MIKIQYLTINEYTRMNQPWTSFNKSPYNYGLYNLIIYTIIVHIINILIDKIIYLVNLIDIKNRGWDNP